MNELNELQVLIMIGSSLAFGGILGAYCMIYLNKTSVQDLNEELDKFRMLYFDEVDKWKNKYKDTDPNNELEP